MIIKRIFDPALALLLLLSIVSCDAGKRALQTPSGGATSGQNGAADNTGEIKILPDSPTPQTDLLVVLSSMKDAVYRWEKNGQVIAGETSSQLSKSHLSKGDRITVSASVGNRNVAASTQIGNTPPVVQEVAISPQYISHGVDITATPTGYDADGDHVTFAYRWSINGVDCGEHTEVLHGDTFKKGDKIVLAIVPSDSQGEGEVYTSVPLVIPNAPPRFTSVPSQFASSMYEYSAHAEDPDGDRVTYSLHAGPSGMTVDADTGKVLWPVSKVPAGNYTVEIQAQDDSGLKVIQTYILTLTPPEEPK